MYDFNNIVTNQLVSSDTKMISEDVQYEVQVTNAYKNYGEKNVFNGLNMKVRSGSMWVFFYFIFFPDD